MLGAARTSRRCRRALTHHVFVLSKREGLPYRMVKLVTDTSARESGFRGPEVHDLFADWTDARGPSKAGAEGAPLAGSSSRPDEGADA